MSSPRYDLWPVALIEDRYAGAYSDGAWIAIAKFDDRRYRDVMEGAHGWDGDALSFWESPPAYVAVGDSPAEALAALYAKMPKDGAA